MNVPKESQPVEAVAEPKEVSNPILELDLKAAGITSIVWATGFRYDFGWVKLPISTTPASPFTDVVSRVFPGSISLD